MRADRRQPSELRPLSIEPDYLRDPLGSALVRAGHTWVLCTASVEERVPPFLRDAGTGWVTAEYGMLPGSTSTRNSRGPNGRAKEIERLIGRALRAAVDLARLGPRTVTVDCDVLQADGGTRTAAITGGYVALSLCCERLVAKGLIAKTPLSRAIAAVSVGIVGGVPYLDLPYEEDSRAEVDMNVVMARGFGQTDINFVEVQGTGEKSTFSRTELDQLCDLAQGGIADLMAAQIEAIGRACR